MQCHICGHVCQIPEGGTGRCRMQTCSEGVVHERFADKYLALWPSQVETVPFLHYTPGGRYLLLSTLGCNLSCPGCVSHMLVSDPDLIADALFYASPDDILKQVREHSCLGAIFCLNEPSVSLDTVISTATVLKKSGFLVGCASNGCMDPMSLERLLPHLDMINIGMKGSSDVVYRECGAPCGISQVLDSIRVMYESGVHLEVSVMYQRGREDDVIQLAQYLALISVDIPLHIMRFIPFGNAHDEFEPTPDEAEMIVSRCRTILTWVYLFNTPGTDRLNTDCPDCGTILIDRTFYGPMGARLTNLLNDVKCTCGREVPITGDFYQYDGCEPRFRGGYRTSVLLDIVTGTLLQLGISDEHIISRVLVHLLSGQWLEDLQKYFATPEGYIEYIKALGSFAGVSDEIQPLIRFYTGRLQQIQSCIAGASRPRVYCALSHPYLACYPDKMEVAMAERCGGFVLNYQLNYSESRPEPLSKDEFLLLNPDIILCFGMGKSSVEDFIHHCQAEGLHAPALDKKQVYCLPKQYGLSGIRWVLALEYIAGLMHPGVVEVSPEEDELVLVLILEDLHTRISEKRYITL